MGIVRRADGEGESEGRKRKGERNGEGAKTEERDGDGEVPSAECFPRPPSEVYYRRAVEGPIPGWKTVIRTGKKRPRTARERKGKKPNREQEAGNG